MSAPEAGEGGGGAALAVGVAEATVQVGGRLTPYLRAGRGRAVVLVLERGRAVGPADPLFAELAASRRVVAAEAPELDPGPWLAGLLEGLGLEGADVAVVGEGGWVDGFLARREACVGAVVVLGSTPGPDAATELLGRLPRDR